MSHYTALLRDPVTEVGRLRVSPNVNFNVHVLASSVPGTVGSGTALNVYEWILFDVHMPIM